MIFLRTREEELDLQGQRFEGGTRREKESSAESRRGESEQVSAFVTYPSKGPHSHFFYYLYFLFFFCLSYICIVLVVL